MKFIQTLNERIYWGSKAAGILCFAKDTNKFLISKRSEDVDQPLTYGIVGGKIDNDEVTFEQAAIREFKEETDYDGNIELFELYKFQDNGFEYQNYLGIIENQFNPSINWETLYYKWLSIDEILSLKNKHFGLKALLKESYDEILSLTSK